MTTVSARDALLYATGDEMLKLYGSLIGSWVLAFFTQFVLQTSVQPIMQFGAVVVLLASGIAFISSVVAIAYKVLAES
ncbi:hypothetical protein SAMN05421858_2917 [Haladaptatus litoreus]|uniref:Uncharacterized protein n=1 Tax=Haladaptatus litoreus TaxID=553468 RepID=A0A1N7C2D9_9EURY|nr:hypothetical protein [Haladaptatus litoreus]SIR57740.1 hypothetical protein SAMN05421858_2917 [Haladaptatus litoreus]